MVNGALLDFGGSLDRVTEKKPLKVGALEKDFLAQRFEEWQGAPVGQFVEIGL